MKLEIGPNLALVLVILIIFGAVALVFIEGAPHG